MGAGRKRDVDHLLTPPDQRGPRWWLEEHRHAERSVELASAMVDHAKDERTRDRAGELLDRRLDHLEDVEGAIDAILDDLSRTSKPWVVEAVRRWYVGHEAWGEIAADLHYSEAWVRESCAKALRGIERNRSQSTNHATDSGREWSGRIVDLDTRAAVLRPPEGPMHPREGKGAGGRSSPMASGHL